MSTLYTRDGEDIFELPGRTVNTFTSGLVRVDTSYAIKTSNIAAARSVDFQVGSEIVGDSYPAVDGLFLYPEPQEVRRETGITELMASYYGRTITDVPPPVATERTIELIGTSISMSINDLFFQFVVPVGEIINFRDQGLFDSPLTEPNEIYYLGESIPFSKSSYTYKNFDYYNYNTIPETYFEQPLQLIKPSILVIAQRNFGNFVELDVTYTRKTTEQMKSGAAYGWIDA
jgi:hypothetical protein